MTNQVPSLSKEQFAELEQHIATAQEITGQAVAFDRSTLPADASLRTVWYNGTAYVERPEE